MLFQDRSRGKGRSDRIEIIETEPRIGRRHEIEEDGCIALGRFGA
jgi:hypothetical protein